MCHSMEPTASAEGGQARPLIVVQGEHHHRGDSRQQPERHQGVGGTTRASAAQQVFDKLSAVGIDLVDVFEVLESEGVAKFEASWKDLLDATQSVAKAYDAACTPDLYLFDGKRKLVYRGQFDESRPGRGTPTGKDLRAACDALLNGTAVSSTQSPSLGCNIKWKN